MESMLNYKGEESCLTTHSDLVHCTKCHCRNHSEIIMSGFLIKSPPLKKSIVKKRWHKRYFILRADKTLEYYTNSTQDNPIAIINLKDVQRIEIGLGNDKFGNIFDLVTLRRTYFFSAGSSDIMQIWVDQIKGLLEITDVTVYETEQQKTCEPNDELMQYYVDERLRKKDKIDSLHHSIFV
ncbi:GRB2-associated-binding protein 1-like [Oopsacas minuta]|uniref:GRB2-associated-binding protein 1-like n=1 Tax=Oopsacas minuta TaxID=111878 RepID=A0AAV7KDS9_9METZ|nr:GRB2-associated-binding protein 1-like [Oopsacas minuta]